MFERDDVESQPFLQLNQRPEGSACAAEVTPSPLYPSVSPTDGDAIHRINPMDLSSRHRAAILAGLWLATFLSALNSTMVATLISSIASEFHSAHQASWLGTSFLLATCTFTPLYGRLSNAAGRRGASLTAIFFCGLGTLACGLSTRLEPLIVCRFIAGIGGGGIFTTASICVSDLYSMRNRSLTQGFSNIFVGLGLGLGGPLGGYIADRFGWRWAFLSQLPLFALSFAVVSWNLNYVTPGRSTSRLEVLKRIDYLGCATLLFAVSLAIYGLLTMRYLIVSSKVAGYLTLLSLRYNEDLSWAHPGVITSAVLTAAFFLIFVFVELFFAAEPVLAPALLRMRVPVLVGLSNMIVSVTNFSVQYYLPMWFEIVQGTTVTISGFHIMPNSAAMSIGSLVSGVIMHHTGKYKMIGTASGILPILAAIALARLKTDSWAITQWLSIIPLGFGNAVVLQTTLIALLASIPQSMVAVGTGFTQLFRGIGQVSGVAVSSALFQHLLQRELSQRITGTGSENLIREMRHSSSVVKTLPPEMQALARAAYSYSLQRVFWLTAGVAALGFLIRLAIPELCLDDQKIEETNPYEGIKSDPDVDSDTYSSTGKISDEYEEPEDNTTSMRLSPTTSPKKFKHERLISIP